MTAGATPHPRGNGSDLRGAGALLPVRQSGAGPPVVFLHGYPLDHRMWGPEPAGLVPGHRLYLVDLPGYGDAANLDSPDTLAGFSEAVARTIMALSIGPATIVGHSMGGYIALQLYRDHADLFSALVLTNTRSSADNPEARKSRLDTAARLARPGESLDVDAVVKGLVAPRTWEARGVVVDRLKAIVGSARTDRIIPTLEALAGRPDFGPVLGSIRVPTLVVWGESDALIPPAQSREMFQRIAGAQSTEIRGAGHVPCLEAPDEFYRSVSRFLAGLA